MRGYDKNTSAVPPEFRVKPDFTMPQDNFSNYPDSLYFFTVPESCSSKSLVRLRFGYNSLNSSSIDGRVAVNSVGLGGSSSSSRRVTDQSSMDERGEYGGAIGENAYSCSSSSSSSDNSNSFWISLRVSAVPVLSSSSSTVHASSSTGFSLLLDLIPY